MGRRNNGKFSVWSAAVGSVAPLRMVFWRAASVKKNNLGEPTWLIKSGWSHLLNFLSSNWRWASTTIKQCFVLPWPVWERVGWPRWVWDGTELVVLGMCLVVMVSLGICWVIQYCACVWVRVASYKVEIFFAASAAAIRNVLSVSCWLFLTTAYKYISI